MGAVKAEDKEKYYETSRTWEYDRMRAAIQSKRLAWGVAAVRARSLWRRLRQSRC